MADDAMINIGLMPDQFWNMSFVDYLRLHIHEQLRTAQVWDIARNIMSLQINTNVPKNKQKKPKDLAPLWTDKWNIIRKSAQISEAEKQEILKRTKK